MPETATIRLRRDHEVWDSKPALRAVYTDYFDRMRQRLTAGPTLEVGSGTGRFRQTNDDLVCLDVQAAPWIDVVADAHRLPFAEGSFANIVMLDVLHHLECPMVFLAEASRVLRRGGRLILIEPGITLLSGLLYRTFHEEPVRMGDYVFGRELQSSGRDPYDSNQAIPTLLFERNRRRVEAEIPDLKITEIKRLSLWAYPLSGGFQPWSLIPKTVVRPLLAVEDKLLPWLGRWMAMRLLVVLERR